MSGTILYRTGFLGKRISAMPISRWLDENLDSSKEYFASDMEKVSQYGWRRRGDQLVANVRNPYIRLTLRQIIDVIPFLCRYIWYWLKMKWDHRVMFINSLQPLTLKPIYGVPCGGIGSGAIGRDFRGGFCKFSLRPGMVEHSVADIPANQFIVTVRRNGVTLYQSVLNCAANRGSELNSWSFGFPGERLHYTGLYPRAWSVFHLPCCNGDFHLICRQVSPVIPNDYRESCIPAAAFVWTIVNNGADVSNGAYEVSITFTFRNGTGLPDWRRETVCHCRSFDGAAEDGAGVRGIALEHTIDGMRCTYALAAHDANGEVRVSRRCFDPCGDGHDLWNDLLDDGALGTAGVADWCYVKERRELAVALCVKTSVKPGSTVSFDACLTWDMPIVMFGGRRRTYARRYTRWFGRLGDAAPALCAHTLKNYRKWEQKIDEWQQPILTNPNLPAWYKSAIFNELYFVTDGGTVWFEYNEDWRQDEPYLSDYTTKRMKEYGRFGYLESWEYLMINTYDVHFYASFALARLWPEIEVTVQAEFTDQISNEDLTPVRYHFDGEVAPAKTKNRVPHDLGNPAMDAWFYTNAYVMHNTAVWRDLNLKFVLTCYRDYLLLANGKDARKRQAQFLEHVWPAIEILIDVGLDDWDADKDGMIENSGTCDQTYDAWKMYGTSAYCGSLWLGALKTAIEIGRLLKREAKVRWMKKILDSALIAYDKKLWQGEYYKFDENSRGHKSIMADQLCGYWYLKSCGLAFEGAETDPECLPKEKVCKALRKIYEFNVQKFKNGSLGAVNGIFPDGRLDKTSIQSAEVWTGVTYSLAAMFIMMGMPTEGFQTAGGLYRSIYDDFGMQYQTPEAVYARTNYRALGYMRALAIWSMQWALDRCGEAGAPIGDRPNQVDQRDDQDVPLLNGD